MLEDLWVLLCSVAVLGSPCLLAAGSPWLQRVPGCYRTRISFPHVPTEHLTHPLPPCEAGPAPGIRPLTQPGRVVPRGEQLCLPTSCDTAGTEPAPPGHGQGTAPECLGTPGQPGHGQLGGPR